MRYLKQKEIDMNCCENCKYCECNELQDYICTNADSEYVADFVEPEHSCIDFEPKEN